MKQTIFLVAGCPSTDVHAAQFMRKMKAINPLKEYHFIGIGGNEMKQEGFQSIGVTSDQFAHKPFFPHKNFHWISSEQYLHPVHAYTHIKNQLVMRQLKFDEILAMKPAAFITFENQFFMKYFYLGLRNRANELRIIHPPTFFWGLTHKNEYHHHQQWLDHFFNRIPLAPINWARFNFPHTQVGWEGLFRAYKFLFSRNEKYKALTEQEGHIFFPAKVHRFPIHDLISELVMQERQEYRKNNKIEDQSTVLFLAIGNNKKEIQWSIKTIKEALDKFFKLDEMKNIPLESLSLIISVPPQEDLQALAQLSIQKYSWPIRVIQVNTEDEKFQAMAASDIGLAVNGQIVAECAGLQLPTIVLDPEPLIKSYYKSLWNSFCLDLNIAVSGEAYPELLGSSIPMNIALNLQEIYQDPKLRYYFVDRYKDMLINSMNCSPQPPTQNQTDQFPQTTLVGYRSGMMAMAETVNSAADKFQTIDDQIPVYKRKETRIKVLQELGWAKGL